jgi:hypothetical protein
MALGAPIEWHKGAVVLNNLEVYSGEISVQPIHDLILFRTGETITVYPAHRIKSFNFYDDEANINRKFISLKENHVARRAYHLYEVVLRGELMILRKQKKERSTQQTNHDKFDFDYFINDHENLVSLMYFRSTLYPTILKIYRQEILSFIHQNNLNPNQPGHAIQIIEFYNQQVKQNILAGNY